MRKSQILFFLSIISFHLIAQNRSDTIAFSINDKEEINLNRYFCTTLLDENIEISFKSVENIILENENQTYVNRIANKWVFTADDTTKDYNLIFKDTLTGECLDIVIFVLEPYQNIKKGYLNGYRIGNYPEENYKGRPNYRKPKGFIEVTEENKDIYISPSFQLKQFLCKQNSSWPKYVIVNPKLILKLEYLVQRLNQIDENINTLFIMSGFRTPYYNKSIGNVKFSRHVFGDAADVYVDVNLDDIIDDLNSDGKHDINDVIYLKSLINDIDSDPENEHLHGGVGKYNKNSAHTFFIHVDTRGYKAYW